MANGILIIGLLILTGFIGRLLFEKTRIPESVFLMIIGVLLGPVFHLVSPEFFSSNASFLISFALVIVLLDSGLGLNVSKAAKNIPFAFTFTLLVMVATSAFVALATSIFFDWPIIHGIFLGVIVSGTTTITVTHLVERLKVGKNTRTLLILESIVNDITLITAASILIAFLTGKGNMPIATVILNELVISVMLGLMFALLWAFVSLRYTSGSKLAYVFTLGFAFTLYDSMEFFGYNGAIAVLIFGLALGNYSQLSRKLKKYMHVLAPLRSDIALVKGVNTEITFIMRTLFFVFLGVIFSVQSLQKVHLILLVASIAVAELLARYVSAKAIARYEPKFSASIPIITTLVASGFTSTLVAFLSIEAGIVIPNLTEIILLLVMATTFISIVGTAVLERRLIVNKVRTH